MPKKKVYLQVTFEQGMVDTVVSDYDYQDSDLKWKVPQSRSAVYIKNYDPSIVKNALTKRYGYGFLRDEVLQNSADIGLVDRRRQPALSANGLPATFSINGIIRVDLGRFTTLVDQEQHLGGPLAAGIYNDPLAVCGALALTYNKPVSQQIVIYFVRHVTGAGPYAERTRVISYVNNTGIINELPRWHNAHTNGSIIPANQSAGTVRATEYPHPYPGWDIYGTFTDCAKHGGTLVITSNVAYETYPWNQSILYGTTFQWTTSVNPWLDNMYPCYIWTYWDLRRKRNDGRKFYNLKHENPAGTVPLADLTPNYNTDQKYMHFKVLTPAMRLTRDSQFVTWKTYTTSSVFTQCSVDSRITAPATTRNGDIAEILNAQGFNAVPANNAVIEVSIIEFRGRSYNATAVQQGAGAPVPDDQLAVTAEYPWLNVYSNHIPTIELLNVNPQWPIDTGSTYWLLHHPYNNTVAQLEELDIIDGELTYGNVKRRTKIVATIPQGTIGWLQSTFPSDTIPIGDTKGNYLNDYYWTVGISLPDYLGSGAPRPWMQGEEIPFCLTATIRNAEIIVGTYTHVIQSTDYIAYPSMWWPGEHILDAFGLQTTAYRGTSKDEDYGGYQLGAGPDAHGDAVSEAFYLAKDGLVKFNSRYIYVAAVRAYSFRPDPYVPTEIHYAYYKNYKPWCIEPFNPTSNDPHVISPTDVSLIGGIGRLRVYHRATDFDPALAVGSVTPSNDNNASGYRREHTNPKLLMFTIKINGAKLSELLELGVEAFNLYAAQPSENSLFNSVGLSSLQDPLPGIYMLPDKPEEDDYTKYRLLKRFIVDGDGQPYNNFGTANDDTYWKKYYRGQPTSTNSWAFTTDNNTNATGVLIATGQQKSTAGAITALEPTLRLTPDFLLWDYPISQPLTLNSSGKYWQGRGAKLICNIKGRTFLGGVIDSYGEEEQAIIRYSDVQSGVITLDVFSEESQIRIGGLPHTALIEYREHLWVFNRQECHRIQMPDVVDITSWEYLDKIPGQGTFNNKTVITTPYGVIWANEGGVWLSDGRMPENIAENVLTFYKSMATNAAPYYATKITLPKFPYDQFGYNPYLEIAYDEFANELVVCSPSAEFVGVSDYRPEDIQLLNEEWRLVFSFKNKTWHIQHADLPAFNNYLNEYDKFGKMTF